MQNPTSPCIPFLLRLNSSRCFTNSPSVASSIKDRVEVAALEFLIPQIPRSTTIKCQSTMAKDHARSTDGDQPPYTLQIVNNTSAHPSLLCARKHHPTYKAVDPCVARAWVSPRWRLRLRASTVNRPTAQRLAAACTRMYTERTF